MIRMTILAFILMLFVSCDWMPERIQTFDTTIYESRVLAVGDTARVLLSGNDYDIRTTEDASIAEAELRLSTDDADTLIIIGLSAGKTSLLLAYDPTSTADEGSVLHSIQLVVSDGIPLTLFTGEDLSIALGEHLSPEELAALDSTAITLDFEVGDEVFLGGVQDNVIHLAGFRPGTGQVSISLYDEASLLISHLLFDIQVQIRKRAMAELFTNSGCVNCPEANHYLDNILDDQAHEMVLVRYHVNWTDPNDPMNLYNPTEVEERRAYYNIFQVPTLVIDGEKITSLDETDWSSRISTRAQGGTNTSLSTIEVLESSDSLFLSYELESFGADLGSVTVSAQVLEDSIYFAGTNGETIHRQVMRDMTSTQFQGVADGQAIQQSLLKPNDVLVGTGSSIVVYVQDTATKSILQARSQDL